MWIKTWKLILKTLLYYQKRKWTSWKERIVYWAVINKKIESVGWIVLNFNILVWNMRNNIKVRKNIERNQKKRWKPFGREDINYREKA